MDNAPIRSPQSTASTSPLARSTRHASATEAAGAQGKGGFSLLLADIADIADIAGTSLPSVLGEGMGDGKGESEALLKDPLAGAVLPAPELTLQTLSEGGIFSLTSLVAQTARMDGAADAAQRDGRVDGNELRSALPKGLKAALGAMAAAQTPGSSWGDASAAADKGAATGKGAALAAMADATAVTAEPSTLSLTQPAKEITRDAQPHGLAALLAQMDAEPTPAGMTTSMAGSAGVGADYAAGAAPEAGAVPAHQGVAEVSASTDASQTDAPQLDAVLSLPDEALADQLSEQVAFWVQQKTQRAEMTIDRQGQPVQVQVAINGNEAHVTFRSSEQQTRDMLDASVAQLRELLEQQGLSLAGVTVQTADSGRQGSASGGQGSAGRPAALRGDGDGRQTAVVSADLRARPDALRTVDLFV